INPKKKPFVVVIPPPNVTGILHMGHALNNTIQDVLVRFKRMNGWEVLWMPGTDHAGIATQNVVERELAKEGKRKEDIGREKFLEKLWLWKDNYGSTIIEQLQRIGASCDWERLRFTMDDSYSEAVKDVFITLYKKGLIYRSNYIINWCPRCKTALSDEEVSHRELEGWLYYIRYPLKTPYGDKSYIVVATTRPETMLGDTAIAVNPRDERYNWLKNNNVILPIINRQLKIIEDEIVDPEFGTGVVKVTPSHDPVDFTLGKKYNLDFINIMNEDATLNEKVPSDLIGMDRFEARENILNILKDKDLIEKEEPYRVKAGHCYRCYTIIEPRISLQWFVKMKPLAKKAIEVVKKDKIKFYPQRWQKVYLNWMNNIQDWCISRQIWWGHRLPVWECECQAGVTLQQQKSFIVSKTKPKKNCLRCNSEYKQHPDVLDTWFSSWLWPFATLGWPKKTKELSYFYPTNCLVTASEILFFWVARMIMAGLKFKKQIPFRDVIIHGTVRDQSGIKMSKSLGNTIDPLEIVGEFGADALRFSLVLLAASGSDIYLSKEKFLVGRNFANKIWNATRFILLKIKESDYSIKDFNFDLSDEIDRWILIEFNRTLKDFSQYLNNYIFNEGTKTIYDFFWHYFCDWYIEIAKDRFTLDRAKILIFVLLNSIKILHPLMPFITEEIYSLIKDFTQLSLEKTISISSWPKEYNINNPQIANIDKLFKTITAIRNIRVDLGLGQKKANLEVKIKSAQANNLWQTNLDWIKRLTLSENITFTIDTKRVLYDNNLWALDIDIPTEDLNNFLSSLKKRLLVLEGILDKTNKQLNNEKFLANATKEIVQKEKEKFKDISEELTRLKKLKDAFK
ncbi:MAG: valine--tRNA ligase, partial [Candidatus Omnitrophica bacterium]|nr:valine--tRNA ligase [Candidatus Omnitrophota bacterium]